MSTSKPTLAELREALPLSTAPDNIIQSPFYQLGRLQEAVSNEPRLEIATRVIMAALVEGARAKTTLESVRYSVRETGE